MRRAAALLALLLTLLALPATAAAGLAVGVTDDTGSQAPDGGTSFLATLADVGLTENQVTVLWNPDSPTTIPGQAGLDAYVANATAAGVRVDFAVYPSRPTGLTASPVTATAQFANFLTQLAQTYPQVTDYVVGNEPNLQRFWQPQFSATGGEIACASYEPVLALGYDALKAVNPAITVIGVGLSPRGNDRANAASDPSASPVRCLHDIGLAYRASGRTKPIMDQLGFHAYPEKDSQPFGVPSSWPKAGMVDLARIKQAVWDAFNGTAQPTFAEAGQPAMLPALKLRVSEVGWQVGIIPTATGAYTGTENVATTDETNQAVDYTQAIRLLACDPSVGSMLFFGLEDQSNLAGWQAGLLRADGTQRPSYDAVKSELATSHGQCAGLPVSWTHATGVVGVTTKFDQRKQLPATFKKWSFTLGVKENANFTAGLFRLPATVLSVQSRTLIGRALTRPGSVPMRPTVRLTGRAPAPFGRTVTFRQARVKAGTYVYAIRLTAEMNPDRVTIVTGKPFRVGKVPARRRSSS